MLKNILELNGTKELNKNEQTSINGGFYQITNIVCNTALDCIEHGADRCYRAPYYSYGRCVIF